MSDTYNHNTSKPLAVSHAPEYTGYLFEGYWSAKAKRYAKRTLAKWERRYNKFNLKETEELCAGKNN